MLFVPNTLFFSPPKTSEKYFLNQQNFLFACIKLVSFFLLLSSSLTLSLTTKERSLLISAFWQTLTLWSHYIFSTASHMLNQISVGSTIGFNDGFNSSVYGRSLNKINCHIKKKKVTNVLRKQIFHRIKSKLTKNTIQSGLVKIKKGKNAVKIIIFPFLPSFCI